MMRRSLYIIMCVCAVAISTSCEHKELCEHHAHAARVRLDVDWSEFHNEEPTGMTVMLYSENPDVKPVKHLTNTTTHAVLDLTPGSWRTFVFNQSEEEYGSVLFRGMESYETAEVYTRGVRSTWYVKRGDEEFVASEAEWIGTGRFEDIHISQDMVDYTGEQLLYQSATRNVPAFSVGCVVPHNIVYTIKVKVHIKGFHNLRAARASLNGLAEGYFFGLGKRSNNKVVHLLENWQLHTDNIDPTKGYITGQLNCFGLPGNHSLQPEDNLFVLELLLVDNKTKREYEFNVGDKFYATPDDELELRLNLELEIPDTLPDVKPEGGSNSAFDAKVDEWGDEENYEVGL